MSAPLFDTVAADLEWVRPAIERIMRQHPDISADGWKCFTTDYSQANFKAAQGKMLTEDFAKQVLTAWHFVGCTYLEKYGSYTLKHAAERFGKAEGQESYICNGALIVAAIIRRYTPKRKKNSPNCIFLRNGKSDTSACKH